MPPPDPPQLTPLEIERLTLLTAPVPPTPTCDALSTRFPVLTYFVRMLAVLLAPDDIDDIPDIEEALTVYTMGWHCAPDEAPRDCPDAFARFAASELDEDAADRLDDFACRFTLFFTRCPQMQARFKRLSCRPHTVVLPV